MAQPTSTFSTYDAVGIREDLSDFIYDVSPTETPFLSMAKKGKASNTLHEWQTDALAAASGSNAVIEGDDATTDAITATTRLGNYTQISDKVARVTGTMESVNKAGRGKEMAYQLVKRGKELKRDMETSLTANTARAVGTDTTARVLGGLGSWVATNTDHGGGSGADPTGDGTDARTDGDTRVFKESQLKTVLAACFDSGGNPDTVMVNAFNKQKFSGFTGSSTRMDKGEDKRLVAAIDVYVSDFGELKVIPNRFQRGKDAWVLESDYWQVAYLRNMATKELARTGDSERRQILCEYTLVSKNEAASGLVTDLTTA